MFLTSSRLFCRIIPSTCYHTSAALKAKPGGKPGGKVGQPIVKVILDVESDPQILLTKCCGANIYIDGVDPVIKSDSEYPDWLWTLRTDRTSPKLDELDPDTKYYWNRLRKMTLRRKNQLRKVDRIK